MNGMYNIIPLYKVNLIGYIFLSYILNIFKNILRKFEVHHNSFADFFISVFFGFQNFKRVFPRNNVFKVC